MKRKLVKQGAATMMISLPSKWIRKNGLNKGDEIDLEEKEGDIILRTDSKSDDKKEIELTLDGDNKNNLRNLLTHIYRQDFDRIVLKEVNNNDLKEIKRVLKFLLGFEIVSNENNICIIENISEPFESKYPVMVRKIFYVIDEHFDYLRKILVSGKYDEEDSELLVQGDTFVLFCRRLLTKSGINSKSMLEWEFLTHLMGIQHELHYLYEYSKSKKLKFEEKDIKILDNLKDYFKLLTEAYLNSDIKKIHEIKRLKEKYHFGEVYVMLEKSSGTMNVFLTYVWEIFRRVNLSVSPVLAMILDKGSK